ncbi:MAG: hypothetical protein JW786_02350 [Desulfobacterales bacterium]|nr:hypothetical protein [Desulfobacterales bacterium]
MRDTCATRRRHGTAATPSDTPTRTPTRVGPSKHIEIILNILKTAI